MNKNRLFLGISIVSLLMMGLVMFNPFTAKSAAKGADPSDFQQRHPDWIWTTNRQNSVIPITGGAAFPDYYERHPELSEMAVNGSGASDYFERHPELSNLAALGQGASDYFERHPELVPAVKSNVDLTDYYFRHPELSLSAAQSSIDLTDYYFRHINQH